MRKSDFIWSIIILTTATTLAFANAYQKKEAYQASSDVVIKSSASENQAGDDQNTFVTIVAPESPKNTPNKTSDRSSGSSNSKQTNAIEN